MASALASPTTPVVPDIWMDYPARCPYSKCSDRRFACVLSYPEALDHPDRSSVGPAPSYLDTARSLVQSDLPSFICQSGHVRQRIGSNPTFYL